MSDRTSQVRVQALRAPTVGSTIEVQNLGDKVTGLIHTVKGETVYFEVHPVHGADGLETALTVETGPRAVLYAPGKGGYETDG